MIPFIEHSPIGKTVTMNRKAVTDSLGMGQSVIAKGQHKVLLRWVIELRRILIIVIVTQIYVLSFIVYKQEVLFFVCQFKINFFLNVNCFLPCIF